MERASAMRVVMEAAGAAVVLPFFLAAFLGSAIMKNDGLAGIERRQYQFKIDRTLAERIGWSDLSGPRSDASSCPKQRVIGDGFLDRDI